MSGGRLELELDGARVLFTTRAEGSLAEAHTLARLERELGVRFARGRQVHGARVRRVIDPALADRLLEADGQATALREVAPVVLTADCLPVAVLGARAVAMLHAGWRGLAAGVLEEGVEAVRELGGDGGGLRAVIGPGARACCYEVGEEVHAAFGTRGATLDLKAIALARLERAGVLDVVDVGTCTICDAERFFSHRREGAAAGRQAGIVWLR